MVNHRALKMQCFNALMHFLLAEQPSLQPASVSAATILQIILPVPLEGQQPSPLFILLPGRIITSQL